MIPLQDIQEAYRYDRTLKTNSHELAELQTKYLRPIHYSQKALFDAMQKGKTIVFDNYPVKDTTPKNADKTEHLLSTLRNGLDPKEKIYIRYGSSRTLKKVTIHEVIDRWVRKRSKFGVTDLHFRNTSFYKKIDAGAVSHFNLLPLFPQEISFLEMLTLVISSKGIFSDSHSDDGDGSNHCIVGKKLWFAWDKAEGQKVGLEDCTYDPVYKQARFSIKKFLSLKSSHWFIVSEGRTLFMPGNFTHKVITLEPYIGYGSFYLSFPNMVNSLKRWILKYSSDVNLQFIETFNRKFPRYLQEVVTKKSKTEQSDIGFDYFISGLKNRTKGLSASEAAILSSRTILDQLAAEIKY